MSPWASTLSFSNFTALVRVKTRVRVRVRVRARVRVRVRVRVGCLLVDGDDLG